MTVVGLDLSLTATGVATPTVTTTVTTKTKGVERLAIITAWIEHHVGIAIAEPVEVADPLPPLATLVVIEGYAYGSRASQAHSLGELGGVVRLALWRADVPFVEVPPSSLKMYATGHGIASKTEMVIAARDRLGYEGSDDNEADAMWLRALGCDLASSPLVKLPQTHRRALDKVEMP